MMAASELALDWELRIACREGKIDQLRNIFESSVAPASANHMAQMVQLALGYNQPFILDYLLSNGGIADVAAGIHAARLGSVTLHKILVAHGLSINADFDMQGDAVGMAAFRSNITFLTYLLDSGAEILSGRMIDYQYTPLAVAAMFGTSETVRFLVSRGAAIPKSMALHWAASEGKVESMKALVELGADVNEYPGSDDCFATFAIGDLLGAPLDFAAEGQYMNAVQYLLDCGAKTNTLDQGKRTVLQRSGIHRNGDVWQELVEVLESVREPSQSSDVRSSERPL